METIKGNKLIAEFDGWEFVLKHQKDFSLGNLKYHSSWDWLMPVVEKIGKMYDKKECNQVFNLIPLSIFAPINVTWDYVIKFVQWYNNNKPQPNAK